MAEVAAVPVAEQPAKDSEGERIWGLPVLNVSSSSNCNIG